MSDEQEQPLELGERVFYYDDDKQPCAAWVAHIFDKVSTKANNRPLVNLTVAKHDARIGTKMSVEPAYHDGEKWILLNKWSFPGEVPSSEWSHLSPPACRPMKAYATGT